MDEVCGTQSARLDAQAWEIGTLKAEVFRLQAALAEITMERDATIALLDALADLLHAWLDDREHPAILV